MTVGDSTTSRRRNRRMDLRTTPEERELIDRAVAATGTDLTDFVITHASDAARRVLTDRDHFELDGAALEQWGQINARPARELAGLKRLMERPSPFTT
ncbi:MAG: type II toxin-antitoxin system TacA family antitoxin [Solirubrobacteraceae bacterium]